VSGKAGVHGGGKCRHNGRDDAARSAQAGRSARAMASARR